MKLGGALVIAAVCGALCSSPASALQTGLRLVVLTEGRVAITYLGGDSDYWSALYLDSNDPSSGSNALFNQWTEVGSTIELGRYAAGSELTFRLLVWNTGDTFFTGDGLRNADGIAHARGQTTLDETLHVARTTVGFEDLYGGGDLDFNDFTFLVTSEYELVRAEQVVPEPISVALLGIGLAGLGFTRRRR